MRLSHVSVLREYGVNGRQGGYFVRAELQSQPSAAWSRAFLNLWLTTLSYRKLCAQPEVTRNEILIPLTDGENIAEVVDAVKNTIKNANMQVQHDQEPMTVPHFNEAII
ncbi:MAG: hypothetical protein N2376_01955 [Clostridia bacterium]|nr:hypothetical protein [Clostridia bacterium]